MRRNSAYGLVLGICFFSPFTAKGAFVDLGPLQFGSPMTATPLCAPDVHFKCPEQKTYPTPLPAGEISNVAYRVQSFGDTRITLVLKARGGAVPALIVEGPLPGSGDGIAVGAGKKVVETSNARDGELRLPVRLTEPGVYRVLAASKAVLEGETPSAESQLELNARCASNCERPSLKARDFLLLHKKRLIEQSSLEPFLREHMEETVTPPATDEDRAEFDLIVKQLGAFLRGETARFPVLPPLQQLTYLRPLVAGIESRLGTSKLSPKAEIARLKGSVSALLKAAAPHRPYPEPIYKDLPQVTYGHFAQETLSTVQAAHSQTIADILNHLAAGNAELQYEFKNRARKLHTPWDLFDALMADGHVIEVRNERTYANFIALNDGVTSVQWPVWLDSGVALSTGENMVAPVGHSHHAWTIRGPRVDARISFFLGISGVGFWPQTDERPAWTGNRVTYAVSSQNDKNFVLETVKTATVYFKRIREEARTIAKNKPADGYGYLGLCNDSNAVLEKVTHKTVTVYPIARAAELDEKAPELNDGLDEVLRRLPKDADADLGDEGYQKDVLRRIWAMSAHMISSKTIPDEELEAQLRVLKQDVK